MKDFIEGLFFGLVIGLFIMAVIFCASNDRQTKFCPECGTRYKDNYMYCSFDGSELKLREEG